MTTSQRIWLMKSGSGLWANAARAQGWKEDDRDLRLNVLSEALRRPISGSGQINEREDFDAVKAHLQMLAASVKGTLETLDPSLSLARRLRHKVITQVRCLNLYTDGEALARELIRDKFHRGEIDLAAFNEMPLPRILESLTASLRYVESEETGRLEERPGQLQQLMISLDRLLHANPKPDSRGRCKQKGFRVLAKDSLHRMNMKAGLPCYCTICKPRRGVLLSRPVGKRVHELEEQPF